MKTILVALVAMSASAAADPYAYVVHQQPHESWIDVGMEWVRVDPGNSAAYTGKAARFAPNVMVGHALFVGAELDVGSIGGDAPPGALARGSGEPYDPAVHGSLAAAKAIVGLRTHAHAFSAAAELAAGIRHASLANASNVELASAIDQGVVEAHGRLDFWATPGLTIGALAALDLFDGRNVAFGLQVGLHYR
jgi:hypothetical protein